MWQVEEVQRQRDMLRKEVEVCRIAVSICCEFWHQTLIGWVGWLHLLVLLVSRLATLWVLTCPPWTRWPVLSRQETSRQMNLKLSRWHHVIVPSLAPKLAPWLIHIHIQSVQSRFQDFMSVMSIPDSFSHFGWFCQDASKVCGICPELGHIWSPHFCFNLFGSHEQSFSLFSWGRRAIVFEGAIKVPPAPVYPPSWRSNDPVQNLSTSAFRKMFPISKWFSRFPGCFYFYPCSFIFLFLLVHVMRCPKWQLQIGSLLIQAWFPKFHQDNSGPVPCEGFVSDLWRWSACATHWVFRMDFSLHADNIWRGLSHLYITCSNGSGVTSCGSSPATEQSLLLTSFDDSSG